MIARICLLIGCAALVSGPARGQGLGDAAAREKARRQKQPSAQAVPTYTNDNLPAPATASAAPAGTAPAKASGGTPSAKAAGSSATTTPPAAAETPAVTTTPSPNERAIAEQAYVDAIAAAQRRLTALEAHITELQAQLNPMSSTYVYGGAGSNRADDEIRIRTELRDSDAQLAAARQALEAATQALSDFRAGRRTGPPPGRD
jgi:hypothetical protein